MRWIISHVKLGRAPVVWRSWNEPKKIKMSQQEYRIKRRNSGIKYIASAHGRAVRKEYNSQPDIRTRERIRQMTPKYKQYRDESRRRFDERLFHMLGPKCVKCGYDADIHGLEIDHIRYGQGAEDKRKHGGARGMKAYYHKHPEEAIRNLQVLCGTCHNIKTWEDMHAPQNGDSL